MIIGGSVAGLLSAAAASPFFDEARPQFCSASHLRNSKDASLILLA